MEQLSFLTLGERVLLATSDAEIRYIPGLFSEQESSAYFAFLRDTVVWEETSMWMYDREVDVPRLVSYKMTDEGAVHAELRRMRERLEKRLGVRFNSVGMNLYRNHNDSVAWHSDKNEHLIADPTVAVLSFGVMRPMAIRPKQPPRHAILCDLEAGSALVMSGRAQDVFEHHVPKLARPVGPRISVVFRTTRLRPVR